MENARILIADDEKDTCKYIARQLQIEPEIDAEVDFAHDRDEAIRLLDTQAPYDLILVDLWMPDENDTLDKEAGISVLKHWKDKYSDRSEAIMITANSSSETAIEASSLGVYDYVSKPINYTRLIGLIKSALRQRFQQEAAPPDATTDTPDEYEIIGRSEVMLDVMKKVGRIAASDVDVLVYGESGTGKELVARAIHARSGRRNGPFIPYNCSAVPSELIEAELFGIGKRVATAVDGRPGLFQQARGGTIFLDEIGDLSLEMQPKLLRVLDYKEIQGVGLNVKRVDVRIIAATNRDLRAAVDAGEFRNDLYYRLKFMISLPSLRERAEDIPLLAEHFLRKHFQRRIYGFDPTVLEAFQQHHWPGNVRELEKTIEYAVVTCADSQLGRGDLPPEMFSESEPPKPSPKGDDSTEAQLRALLDVSQIRAASQDFERLFLEHKLKQNDWNIQETAKQIGMNRKSLHRKLNQLGVPSKP
jgi:DNA-binding NtrC family response regulator